MKVVYSCLRFVLSGRTHASRPGDCLASDSPFTKHLVVGVKGFSSQLAPVQRETGIVGIGAAGQSAAEKNLDSSWPSIVITDWYYTHLSDGTIGTGLVTASTGSLSTPAREPETGPTISDYHVGQADCLEEPSYSSSVSRRPTLCYSCDWKRLKTRSSTLGTTYRWQHGSQALSTNHRL